MIKTPVFTTDVTPFTPYLNVDIQTLYIDATTGPSTNSAVATVLAQQGPKFFSCFADVPENFSLVTSFLTFFLQQKPILRIPTIGFPFPDDAAPTAAQDNFALTFSNYLEQSSPVFPGGDNPIMWFRYFSHANLPAVFAMKSYRANFEFDQLSHTVTAYDDNAGRIEIWSGAAVIAL